MYNSKQRKQLVLVTVQLNYSLGQWLHMDIKELMLRFNFSVQLSNILLASNFERLEDILLFSRKGFANGTGLTTEEFEKLTTKEKNRILYLEYRYKIKLVNPDKPLNRNLGKVGMKELDIMLTKLGLKWRGE